MTAESESQKADKEAGAKAAKEAREERESGVSFVKKITPALIRGEAKSKDVIGRNGIIAGTLRSYQTKETNFGESAEFKGEFGLITERDGKTVNVRANRLYVPEVVEGYFIAALANADVEAVDFAGIGFSIRVEAKANESSASGYEWVFEPLVAAKIAESEVDRMLRDSQDWP